MATRLVAEHLLTGHPVHLDHPPRSDERLVAVPRILAPPKAEQRPLLGGHFEDHVLKVRARAEQPETAPRLLPLRIHVDQYA